MTDGQELADRMVNEAKAMVEKLNTHIDLCRAQKITLHLELAGGKIQWGEAGATRQREEETIWSPPKEDDDG